MKQNKTEHNNRHKTHKIERQNDFSTLARPLTVYLTTVLFKNKKYNNICFVLQGKNTTKDCGVVMHNYDTRADAVEDSYFQVGGKVFLIL